MTGYPDPRTSAPTITRPGTPFNPFLTAAAVSHSASGDNTVVAAVAGKTTRVYRLFLVVAGTTVITIKDGAGTALTGVMTFAAGGSLILDFQAEPWFSCTAGNAFIINSSNAVQISGTVYYVNA
jgi:hypothetical protein